MNLNIILNRNWGPMKTTPCMLPVLLDSPGDADQRFAGIWQTLLTLESRRPLQQNERLPEPLLLYLDRDLPHAVPQ